MLREFRREVVTLVKNSGDRKKCLNQAMCADNHFEATGKNQVEMHESDLEK